MHAWYTALQAWCHLTVLNVQDEAAGNRGALIEAQGRLAAAEADADSAQHAQRGLQACLDAQSQELADAQAALQDLQAAHDDIQVDRRSTAVVS